MLKRILRAVTSLPSRRPTGKNQTCTPLSKDITENIDTIKRTFGDATDLLVKEFLAGGRPSWRVAVVLLEGLSDETEVTDSVLKPLMIWARPNLIEVPKRDLINQFRKRLITSQSILDIDTLEEALFHITAGNSVVLVNGHSTALVVDNRGIPSRGIEQPSAEATVRGPRVSFTEVITDNIALIRQRLKTPDLAVEAMRLGRKSHTETRLLYLRSIAQPEITKEVRRRLASIDTDLVLDTGVIQELIRDHPYSLFSTVRSTERPDSVVAELNEGRIVVLIDGSPFAISMPSHFFSFFSSPEDHYVQFPVASTLRIIRISGFFISVIITPLYIALTTFHPELIPLPLLLNIAATQAAVPFPVAVNALGAEIIIEVLREAGVRLPQQFGPAVSIVGALVLGQAAVQAAFISPGLVIVVTTAAIASFAVPRTEASISFRLARFPFLALASILGLYGIALGLLAMSYHVCSMKSFGMPFLALYTPGRVSELSEKVLVPPDIIRRSVRPGARADRTRTGPAPKLNDPSESGDTGEE